MWYRSLAVLVVVAAVLSTTTCTHKKVAASDPLDYAGVVLRGDGWVSEWTAIRCFQDEILGLLWTDDFDSLEKLESALAQHPRDFANGCTLRDVFYDSFFNSRVYSSDNNFYTVWEHFARWERAHPDSKVLPMALASDLCSNHLNFKRRGNKAAASDHLDTVDRVLTRMRKLSPSDPRVEAFQIQYLDLVDAPLTAVDEAFKRAISLDRNFVPAYLAKLEYLQDHKQSWQDFAKTCDDGMYAMLIWRESQRQGDKILADEKLSWPHLRQGFVELNKAHPGSADALNCFCRLACVNKDRALARDLFERIGSNIAGHWLSYAEWNQYHDWAFQRDWWGWRPSGVDVTAFQPRLVMHSDVPFALSLSNGEQQFEFGEQVVALVSGRHFAALEQIAAQLRVSYSINVGGRNLNNFYSAFNPEGKLSPSDLQACIKRWRADLPDSTTVRIVMAENSTLDAWKARGNGYANTVTEAGWRGFKQNLEQAKKYLQEADDLKAADPYSFVLWSTLARGLEFDGRPFFQKGVELYPYFIPLYEAHASYLLPRWDGQPGDDEKLADEAVKRSKDKFGEGMYLVVAGQVFNYEREDFFYKTKFDWSRIKAGYRDLESRAALSPSMVSCMYRMAKLKLDQDARSMARRAMLAHPHDYFSDGPIVDEWRKNPDHLGAQARIVNYGLMKRGMIALAPLQQTDIIPLRNDSPFGMNLQILLP